MSLLYWTQTEGELFIIAYSFELRIDIAIDKNDICKSNHCLFTLIIYNLVTPCKICTGITDEKQASNSGTPMLIHAHCLS